MSDGGEPEVRELGDGLRFEREPIGGEGGEEVGDLVVGDDERRARRRLVRGLQRRERGRGGADAPVGADGESGLGTAQDSVEAAVEALQAPCSKVQAPISPGSTAAPIASSRSVISSAACSTAPGSGTTSSRWGQRASASPTRSPGVTPAAAAAGVHWPTSCASPGCGPSAMVASIGRRAASSATSSAKRGMTAVTIIERMFDDRRTEFKALRPRDPKPIGPGHQQSWNRVCVVSGLKQSVLATVKPRHLEIGKGRLLTPGTIVPAGAAQTAAAVSTGTKSNSVTISIAAATDRAFGQCFAWMAFARSAAARCSSGARSV